MHDSSCKNWENVNTDPALFSRVSWCGRSSQAALREVSGTGSWTAANPPSPQFCTGGFCSLTSPTGRWSKQTRKTQGWAHVLADYRVKHASVKRLTYEMMIMRMMMCTVPEDESGRTALSHFTTGSDESFRVRVASSVSCNVPWNTDALRFHWNLRNIWFEKTSLLIQSASWYKSKARKRRETPESSTRAKMYSWVIAL